MLNQQQVTQFQMLYKNHFGREITKEEACQKGISLLRLVELTYRPMTQKEYNLVQKRRKEAGDL